MRTSVFVCALALMTFVNVTAAATSPKTGDDLRTFLETLAPVYARYVLCSLCGARYNMSKSQCDDAFRKTANQWAERFSYWFTPCKRTDAIRKALTLKYRTKPGDWCDRKWVKKYF